MLPKGGASRASRAGQCWCGSLRAVTIHSFSPIAAPDSHTLILGSMPGKRSLREVEYYAHPQNVFWRIMGELFEIDAAAPYAERVNRLRAQGVALWDVMKTCTRASSLDSDIAESSIVPNDLGRFLRQHQSIRAIFFNGAKAHDSFRKHVIASLGDELLDSDAGQLSLVRLPSTSPAHASMTFAQKLAAWRQITSP